MAVVFASGRLIESNLEEHPDLLGGQPFLPGLSTQRASGPSSLGATASDAIGGAAATNVPMPCRRTTIPWCSSSLNALTTVLGLTDSAFTTSFTLGS